MSLSKYKKGYLKELKEKNELFYEGKSALNWGEMIDGKYQISDRYHFEWKKPNQKNDLIKIEGDIEDYILNFVRTSEKKVTVFIGVDSQNYLLSTTYVCVISLYVEKSGAHLLVAKLKMPKIYDYRYRLLAEADMLGEISRKFEPFFQKNNIEVVGRHLDYNPSTAKKSNGVVTEATNYLKHLGFNINIKPLSWAASHCADFFC